MTPNPQVPRCRSSVAAPQRVAGDGPWFAIPDFSSESPVVRERPGQTSGVDNREVIPGEDLKAVSVSTEPSPEVQVPAAGQSPSMSSRINDVPNLAVESVDAVECDIVKEPVPSTPERQSAWMPRPEETANRLRRWVSWKVADGRKIVTVLGAVALGLLLVLRGGSPRPAATQSAAPDVMELSREVHAIERLAKAPLRLASEPPAPSANVPASTSTAPPTPVVEANGDALFEVKRLQSGRLKAAQVDPDASELKGEQAKEWSVAEKPDRSQNRQAADVRPAAGPSDDGPKPVGVDVAKEDLVPTEHAAVTREKPAEGDRVGDRYPSTDAAKYPAYRLGGSPGTEEERRR